MVQVPLQCTARARTLHCYAREVDRPTLACELAAVRHRAAVTVASAGARAIVGTRVLCIALDNSFTMP